LEQVVLQPNSTITDTLVRMAVLTSVGTSGGMGSEEGESAGASGTGCEETFAEMLRKWFHSWQRTLDAVFGMSDWLSDLPGLDTAASLTTTETHAECMDMGRQAAATVDAAWAEKAFDSDVSDAMIAALASAGAVALLSPPKKRRRNRRRLALHG
jgi:hypothetical protein